MPYGHPPAAKCGISVERRGRAVPVASPYAVRARGAAYGRTALRGGTAPDSAWFGRTPVRRGFRVGVAGTICKKAVDFFAFVKY